MTILKIFHHLKGNGFLMSNALGHELLTVAIKKTRHLVNLPYKAGISN